MRTEDDSFVNISRINGSRVRMRHFVLQSGRGEIFRSLSTIIRSINTTTFALIDRNPLITNQVHSGRKVQLDTQISEFSNVQRLEGLSLSSREVPIF